MGPARKRRASSSREREGRAEAGEPIGLADRVPRHDLRHLDPRKYPATGRPLEGGTDGGLDRPGAWARRLALRCIGQGLSPWTRAGTGGASGAPCARTSSEAVPSGRGNRLAAGGSCASAVQGQGGGRVLGGDGRDAVQPDDDHPGGRLRPVPLALWPFRGSGLRPVRAIGGSRRLLRAPCRGRLSEAVMYGREPAADGRC